MAGSVQTEAYTQLRKALTELRREKGWSQAELAKRLGKPPSFVGKYELGERRLDVIELLVIVKALDQDPFKFLAQADILLPEDLREQ